MDKKKLIGTIIGVAAFAALIAGATYAWLTNALTITNGNYSAGSMNFSVNYVKGTNVTKVPILNAPTASSFTSSTGGSLSVTASKLAGSVDGTLTIKLNTGSGTSAALLSSGALNYAACIGDCTKKLAEETYHGTVSATGEMDLIASTPLTASATVYNVYFWLDPAKVTDTVVGTTFSGYISASAIQTD